MKKIIGARKSTATAYHEAGHAVASWFQGLKFKYVTVKPDAEAGSLGHLLGNRFPRWFQPDVEYSDRQRLQGERRIVADFAGQVAEAKFRRKPPRYGKHSDNQKAVEMAFHLCGCSTKTVEAYLRCCWCQTQDLVNRRWREIEAVAAALLERDTLTYDDVIETARPGSLALRGSLEAGMARKRAVSSRARTVKMNPCS